METDTAIIDTTLLTFRDGHLGLIENGALGITGTEITFVGPANEFDYSDVDRVIDASGQLTMPGFIDAHAHTTHTLLRGGAQDLPEIEWMNKGLGPFANQMSDADRILGSKLGVLEAVRGGATTIVEYADHVAELVEEVYLPYNVRVVATETINEVRDDRSDLGPKELYRFDRQIGEAGFERAESLFGEYADRDLVLPMYGPQALDMISPELLSEIREQAVAHDRRIHMHVAQGERERLQIEERYGSNRSTVSVLNEQDLLDDFLVAAHCHGTTADERRTMVDAGVNMIGCPSSIAMIDGIVPPVNHYSELGGATGLGTDQAPGPGHHNMLRETRTAGLLSKTNQRDPTALPAWKSLQLATIGGAKALGIDDIVGSLEIGKQADIITVDLDTLNTAPTVSRPLQTSIPNLVYSTTGREVKNLFIRGDPVLRDGEFCNIDAEAVITEANQRASTVFERATEDWREAGSTLVQRTDEGWL